MGQRIPEIANIIAKFSNAQVKYHGAKFATPVKSPHSPLNHLTIDADGTLHGWIVTHIRVKDKPSNRVNVREFAESMQNYMKVSVCQIRTMKEPVITHLN